MRDCLFCKVIKAEVPSTKVYENENVYAFKDIYPQAKEHFLFVSKRHSKNILDLMDNNSEDLMHIFKAINEFLSTNQSLRDNGFRIVTNSGREGGQTVFHTHFHLLGGEVLGGFGS